MFMTHGAIMLTSDPKLTPRRGRAAARRPVADRTRPPAPAWPPRDLVPHYTQAAVADAVDLLRETFTVPDKRTAAILRNLQNAERELDLIVGKSLRDAPTKGGARG